MPAHATLLKESLHRSVVLEEHDGTKRIVKRFHGNDFLHRLLDPWRARREWRAIARAHACGLPTPEPLEIEQGARGWQVATRYIERATTLARALADADERGRAAVARALGQLAAKAYAAGALHADLHAGNLLVDGDGALWVVDLPGLRVGGRPSDRQWQAAWVRLVADLREATSLCWRRRVHVAFARAAQVKPHWAADVERLARAQRSADLDRALARWLRTSSATRVHETRERVLIVRRGWSDEQVAQALAGASNTFAVTEAATDAWQAQALLEMHHVPCARPALLAHTSATTQAWFELPPQWTRMTTASAQEHARELGRTVGRLHERGRSRPLELGEIACTSAGEVLLLPGAPLEPLRPEHQRATLDELRAWVGPERAGELATGYIQEYRRQRPRDARPEALFRDE